MWPSFSTPMPVTSRPRPTDCHSLNSSIAVPLGSSKASTLPRPGAEIALHLAFDAERRETARHIGEILLGCDLEAELRAARLHGAAQLDGQLAGARCEERMVGVAAHQREAGDRWSGSRSSWTNRASRTWRARCGGLGSLQFSQVQFYAALTLSS